MVVSLMISHVPSMALGGVNICTSSCPLVIRSLRTDDNTMSKCSKIN